MGVETALFIGASTLIGAGVGGAVSKVQGGDFWKGALVGGLAGAATGGVGAFTGGGAAITGATALKTAMIAGTSTSLAGAVGLTGAKSQGGQSKSDIEKQVDQDYNKAQIKSLTVSQLQEGNQNILGTFGNDTSSFTRARLLNY